MPKFAKEVSWWQQMRRIAAICSRQAFSEKNYYVSFANLVQAVQSSTISPWTYELSPEGIIFTLSDKEYCVPQFYVKITNDFFMDGEYPMSVYHIFKKMQSVSFSM